MAEIPDFFEHFSIIEDPRIDRTKLHSLMDILFIAVCAVICGAEGFMEMVQFARCREEWLRERLELKNGIPSHDTFRRVFSILNPSEFNRCFLAWTQAIQEYTQGEVIALDGKTVRRSFDTALGQPAIHVVGAWATENGMALGQVKVSDKSNEITAIPVLLSLLDVKGRVITLDAMGCQKSIATQIIGQEGDYVFGLKGNQMGLHEDIKLFFTDARERAFSEVEHQYHESIEKDHGRIEARRCWVVDVTGLDWLESKAEWAGLSSIAMIESERHIRGKRSLEVRYYISSLSGSAAKFADCVRKHWRIENSLHYVLDVVFNEDGCRIRKDHAPENLAIMRRIAINLLKRESSSTFGIKGRQRQAAWDHDYLQKVLVS